MITGRASIALEERADVKEQVLLGGDDVDPDLDENEIFIGGIPLTEADRIQAEGIPNTPDLNYQFRKIWGIDKATGAYAKLTSTVVSQIDYDFTKYTAAESEDWKHHLLASIPENRIHYTQPTAESIREFVETQEYFDNPRYQRDNLQQCCTALAILWRGDKTI